METTPSRRWREVSRRRRVRTLLRSSPRNTLRNPVDPVLEALVVADLVAEPAALLEEDAHQDPAPAPRREVVRGASG